MSQGAAGERFDGISAIRRPSEFQPIAVAAGSHVEQRSVPAATLDAILQEANFEGPIDLLSIDVEGSELDVLRGLSFDRHAPRLIILENNSLGADATIREYLAGFGYRLLARSFVNEWYVAPGVDVRRVRFRYPLSMYLGFKLLAAQLGFTRLPGFFPAIKAMLDAEESLWARAKWILFRGSPAFLIRTLFALMGWVLALLRRAQLRR